MSLNGGSEKPIGIKRLNGENKSLASLTPPNLLAAASSDCISAYNAALSTVNQCRVFGQEEHSSIGTHVGGRPLHA